MLLIETAERLFAERGVHGVSLREIGAEGGPAQHWRGALPLRHEGAAGQRRLRAPDGLRSTSDGWPCSTDLDSTGRGYELRGLAEAFLLPAGRNAGDPGRPSWYLRFCIHAAYVEGTAPSDLECASLDARRRHRPRPTGNCCPRRGCPSSCRPSAGRSSAAISPTRSPTGSCSSSIAPSRITTPQRRLPRQPPRHRRRPGRSPPSSEQHAHQIADRRTA